MMGESLCRRYLPESGDGVRAGVTRSLGVVIVGCAAEGGGGDGVGVDEQPASRVNPINADKSVHSLFFRFMMLFLASSFFFGGSNGNENGKLMGNVNPLTTWLHAKSFLLPCS